MDGHDCLECLQYRQHYWTETHGLDCGPYENGWDEWWVCFICGKEFTAKELDFLWKPEGINVKRPNDCCKAFIFETDEGTLTLAESLNRITIDITIKFEDGENLLRLTREQFKTLCGLDSGYDGLEVNDAPEPEAEPEEEDEDVTVA